MSDTKKVFPLSMLALSAKSKLPAGYVKDRDTLICSGVTPAAAKRQAQQNYATANPGAAAIRDVEDWSWWWGS
jgi:hypothetical protein